MIAVEAQEGERIRVGKVVPRFLVPMLRPEWDILSIGCGAGNDVLELRRRGYAAWGLDPSRLTLQGLPEDQREYFRAGTMEDLPFGDRTFDFAYALDVIEHVGCIDFKTMLCDDAWEIRRQFLASCMRAIKPGGVLLLTSSNKLCPVDVGHWHRYHWLGRVLQKKGRNKFGISLPWSRRNFLLSFRDIKRLATEVLGEGRFTIDYVKTATYPGVSERSGLLSRLIAGALRLSDHPLLIGSPLAPVLIVRIRKISAA
ncbi:methyltransferase domain-containing protein [Parvibaculum sedimenti]|uniref:Methyltransferase domain-containing protein n=1 Tax=Parvibaculum sedimenti TaxID=2608632 RepID=A0A6N6VKW6_9HYPH|nr:class I SAM-dependent methyltransferase [Parvibaculum sedimenti]KAB7740663.1 methyltransferase domain-containing protein [Parvibaculum sedimenti]